MQSVEVIYAHCSHNSAQKVRSMLEQISSDYATVHLLTPNTSIIEKIQTFQSSIIHKKLKNYIIQIHQQNTQQNQTHGKQQAKETHNKVVHVYYSCKNQKYENMPIVIDSQESIDKLKDQTIIVLKIDYIWLGVAGKLGSNYQLDKFCELMIKKQNFQQIKIDINQFFMEYLNESLQQQLPIEQILQNLPDAMFTRSSGLNTIIQNHVKEFFNKRLMIRDVTYDQHFKLLLSRNYFHMVWIQCPTLQRYQDFKAICQKKWEHLSKITLQQFLQIDDFWFSRYMRIVHQKSKYVIDRVVNKQTYQEILQEQHHKIIRKFRPSFDQYFISISQVLKARSGCIKEAVGAVLVKDKRIIATGYNGTPINSINCYNGGCIKCNNSECINTQVLGCICIHAEYSCILQAGIKITSGCTLYTTKLPCLWCAKLIVQAQIKTLVYLETSYPQLKHKNQEIIAKMFKQGGVHLKQFKLQGRYQM